MFVTVPSSTSPGRSVSSKSLRTPGRAKEGNGPASGTPVPSRLAIASTDFIAADRVGVEAMGVNPDWMAYLHYCGLAGVGQFDLQRIDIRGEQLAAVQKKYRLHRDLDKQLEWMGPLKEVPAPVG